MSPEQVRGEAAGPVSDVYSLGAILYELLTGQPPFRGASAAEVFGRILFAEPAPPSALRPEAGPALDAVCRKALAKAPDGRYASMRDFASALAEYLRAAPATTRPAPAKVLPSQPWAPPASVADRTATDALPGVARPGKSSGRPWGVGVGVLACLGLLVAASVLIGLIGMGASLFLARMPPSTNLAATPPGPSPAEPRRGVPPREGDGPLTFATPKSTPAESRRAAPPAVTRTAPKGGGARPDLLDCTGAAGVSPAQLR